MGWSAGFGTDRWDSGAMRQRRVAAVHADGYDPGFAEHSQ